ncbi:MAG: hypothetical protein A2X08_14225 [Bacteroidetes bacterium GWA2_32_17]|nr:MAG: hypothetical protein A2X08_14225 [Bacteroidetes bacterium GWA2_32_17]
MNDSNIHILHFVYFLIFLIVSYFTHKFFYSKSTKYNIRKANLNGIRWSSQTKPISGGITFFVILFVSSLAYILYQKDIYSINEENIYIGVVLIVAFLTGLADDMLSISPILKFLAQIACAIILIRGGIYIEISSNFYFNAFFTIFWMVSIMNSINMLDNMDAIATNVSITITLGLILQNILTKGSNIDLFIFLALLSSLISFLKFNWHPAKMYMGDTGSQLLGSFFGAFSIIYFWNKPVNIDVHTSLSHIFIIFLFFLIPIIDTSTVTINRILSKKSPFVGGKDHTTHFFYYRGLSEKKIALLYFLINFISVCLGIVILNFNSITATYISVFSLIFSIFAFLIFYINTRITKPK